MQKIKNLLHHNADANHNGIPDSQERLGTTSTAHRDPIVHDHGTTLPNTIVTPGTAATSTSVLNNDRNMNGIPDNLEGGRRHNPLDKNMDGKVGLSDFLPGAKRQAALNDRNGNGIPDSQERLGGMSNDLNGNGIPDSLERNRLGGLSNDRNMNGIPDNLEGASYSSSSTFSNDRNMNGIPDNLEYSSGSASYVRSAPTKVEVIEKGVVVHEHIHPVEKEEIQPIIYREREQMEVKQITQQLHETQIQPTLIQQRELAAEVRAPIIERGAPIQENLVLPSVDRDATMRSVQVNQAIVNETIKKTVIEEVQPVLERDVFAPTIIQETLPIYEKIVEAPHVYRETLATRELGTRGYQAPIVQQAPIVRETFVPAPVVQQAPLVQPVTMTTTTTTTDSFIPAKLVHDGELRGTNTHAAPTHRKLF